MHRRIIFLIATLSLIGIPLVGSNADAQGYPSRQQPPAQYGYGYPMAPPNYHLLNADERLILQQGEISDGQLIGGGLVTLMFGFGVGHSVQGRFGTDGWKFAVGEGASVVGMLFAFPIANKNKNGALTLFLGSVLTYSVFRLWEIFDIFSGPNKHNQKFRAVQWKAYGTQPPPYGGRYGLYVAPTSNRDGGVAGLRMSF